MDGSKSLQVFGGAESPTFCLPFTDSIRTYLEDDEVELADLTASVLRKLDGITYEEYDSLDLYPDFDD